MTPLLKYELYWSNTIDGLDWANSANPSQPFTYSNGDTTGYGFHGDFCGYLWLLLPRKSAETSKSDLIA